MPNTVIKELKSLSRDLKQHNRDLNAARYIVMSLCNALELPKLEVEKAMRLASASRSEQELQEVIKNLITLSRNQTERCKDTFRTTTENIAQDDESTREAIEGIIELLVLKGVITVEELQEHPSLQTFVPGSSC